MSSPGTWRGRFARLRFALFACSFSLVPFWAVGQVARDHFWITGLFFYIPSAFVAVLLFGWSLVHLWCRRWRAAVLSACLAIAPAGVVLFAENRLFADRPATAGQLRLVHWNVGGRLEKSGAQNVLIAQQADLYVLSEIPNAAAVEELRDSLGAAYEAQIFGNLAVVATGKVRAKGWLIDRRRTKVQEVAWQIHEGTLNLMVVDLPSDIGIHRAPLLREVNSLIERLQPDLVVGDFNAPRRSWALVELPDGYRHGYDTAGSGFGYTWPVPVPIYALDHCIHSRRALPAWYGLNSSFDSDHRMQLFDFTWHGKE
jgi:vancomycin resistance protein VanJ